MSFGEAIKSVFSKYAVAKGRARRSEYWYFTLFNVLISLAVWIIGTITRVGFLRILSIIYSLAVLLPGICLVIRRLHDIGKSGWYYLIGLIPIVGVILLLVWFCTDSEPGTNKYGPNPKGVSGPEESEPQE